jgi:intracellular multiplication protein IcmD
MLKKISKNKYCKFVTILLLVGGVAGAALAADVGIAKAATSISDSFATLAKMLVAVSYVAGFGFVLSSLFKFKQHKDNPAQMPMGTPIALFVIGVALVFLPSVIKMGGQTLISSEDVSSATGGAKGGGLKNAPGGEQ